MIKRTSLGVALFSVIFLVGCDSAISEKVLSKNPWAIYVADEGVSMTLTTEFSEGVMTMTPDVDSLRFEDDALDEELEDLDEFGKLGMDFAMSLVEEMFAEMIFESEYTLKGNTIHLVSKDLDWDDEFKIQREKENIVFTSSNEDENDLVLKPLKEDTKEKVNTKKKENSSKSKDIEEPETKATPTKKKEVSSNSSIGKRSNPVPLGETFTFDFTYYDYDSDDYDEIDGNASVTLSNVVRGEAAYKELLTYNEYNEKAPAGKEWMIVDVQYKLNEGSDDAPHRPGYFMIIDSTGVEVDQDDYASMGSKDEFGYKEIYAGGEAHGKLALLVPVDDDSLIQLRDEKSYFFSLK